MLSNTNRGKKWDRVRVFAVAVFIVFFYHLVRYLFPEIWDNVYCVYYVFLVPVLIAFTLWFRRGNEPLEIRLYLLFWAWVFLSRLLGFPQRKYKCLSPFYCSFYNNNTIKS